MRFHQGGQRPTDATKECADVAMAYVLKGAWCAATTQDMLANALRITSSFETNDTPCCGGDPG